MKFVRETSPYIRKKSSVQRMMADVLIALIPVVIFSFVMNGFKSIIVVLLSLITMILAEAAFVGLCNKPSKDINTSFKEKTKFAYKKYNINNILAPAISAIIYSMMMPVDTKIYYVILGALFGIVVAKLLFGGLGSNIFNPAAAGRVFVMICFGSQLKYSGNNFFDVVIGGTPLEQLGESLLNINNYSLWDLFLGTVPGSMGEASALAILIGGIYLFIRHSADIRSTLSMLISFTILMFVAGLVLDPSQALKFTLYQILAGGLMFGAIFMITDPVTSPTTKVGRIAFGTLTGILVALIRLFGAYPEGVAFAILIMNMFVPVLDYYKFSSTKYNYKQAIAWILVMALFAIIIIFSL